MKRVIIRENHFWSKWKNQVKRISSDQFNLKANSGSTNTVDPNNLDLFYNQNNFSNGAFLLPLSVETLKFFALDPQTYGGDLMIHAHLLTRNTNWKINCSTRSSRRTNYSKVQWNTQLGAIGRSIRQTAFFTKFSHEIWIE
jgi:hypothetical protein